MGGIIKLKINGTFHSGKYGEDFPKIIEMYVETEEKTLGPYPLDMYHCSMIVPEVFEMIENVVKELSKISNFIIAEPEDEDKYLLFPFIIEVIYNLFRRRGFDVATNYPLDFYDEVMIDEMILEIEKSISS